MAYSPKNANGQATMANSEPVVLASDLSAYNTNDTAGKILKDAQKKAKGAYLNTI